MGLLQIKSTGKIDLACFPDCPTLSFGNTGKVLLAFTINSCYNTSGQAPLCFNYFSGTILTTEFNFYSRAFPKVLTGFQYRTVICSANQMNSFDMKSRQVFM